MSNTLNKHYVLVLNAVWQPIGYTTIKQAITAMFSTKDGENMAAQGLDLDYDLNSKGYIDFHSPNKVIPTYIEDWLELPVRDFDIPIVTTRKVIRAPIIIMARNFNKMIFTKLKANKRNLYNMYGGKCIWTGKILSFNEASIEHLTCKSHKGGNDWDNVAIANKNINQERGNIPLEKWKYKQQYPLKQPKSIPISGLINKAVRPEWDYFLIKK